MNPATPQFAGVEAVIFDLDGVLIDSEQMWDEVRRDLAARAGREWPPGATRALQGMNTPEWSNYLAMTIGIPGAAAELAKAVIDAMAARYAVELPLLPGAREAVERLAAHWPLGLASSSPRQLIDAVLATAGISEHFVVTVSTEEVAAGKPSPLVYLSAAQRLGANPRRTVAIEDSTNGLRSAVAAGLVVLAVPNAAFPPAPEVLDLASATVDRLSAVTPELLMSLVAH
jgi:HAD superfamily hydrolase (TIGR01509 family)